MFDRNISRVLSVIVVMSMVIGSFGAAIQKSPNATEAVPVFVGPVSDDNAAPLAEETTVEEQVVYGGGIEKSIPDSEY